MRLGIITLIMFPLLCFSQDGGGPISAAVDNNETFNESMKTTAIVMIGCLVIFLLAIGILLYFTSDKPSSKKTAWTPRNTIIGSLFYAFGYFLLFAFVCAVLLGIALIKQNREELYVVALAVPMSVAFASMTCFLASYLVNVLTDMREYLKRIAEKQ
tara:strand:+ start:59 stop:529 length:471 start_codon:yes stop_codon:yes gene_type:complete